MKDATGKRAKKVEFSLDSIANNPTIKNQISGFIEEISLHQSHINDAKAGIKDILGEAKDSLGIPGKVLMKLVREDRDPGSIEVEIKELDDIQAIAETIANAPVVTAQP
jgi:uncharacterized protein (UPF0335 family)